MCIYRAPLLNLLINCISTRLAPHTLSIKDEYTFIFLNFLIIGFCNYSANSLFETFLFLIPLPANLFRVAHVPCAVRVFDDALVVVFLSNH